MRRCLTHARYLPARAWRSAATPGRTPGRVGGGISHLRLDVRAKSSKASKVGRFPSVPSVETHPLSESGVDLGELCARWRVGAGGVRLRRRSPPRGDAPRRRREKRLAEPPDSVVDAARAAAPPATPLDDESWRLLLSHKNENLYNAYAMEIDSLCPGSRGLTVSFARPRPAPASALARLACAAAPPRSTRRRPNRRRPRRRRRRLTHRRYPRRRSRRALPRLRRATPRSCPLPRRTPTSATSSSDVGRRLPPACSRDSKTRTRPSRSTVNDARFDSW